MDLVSAREAGISFFTHKATETRKATEGADASDAVVGRQRTCDINKFDGDLHTLIRLWGRDPAAPGLQTSRD